jgi:hypothetical protein
VMLCDFDGELIRERKMLVMNAERYGEQFEVDLSGNSAGILSTIRVLGANEAAHILKLVPSRIISVIFSIRRS